VSMRGGGGGRKREILVFHPHKTNAVVSGYDIHTTKINYNTQITGNVKYTSKRIH